MAVLILIFIGCLGLGTMNDIKAAQAKEMCLRQHVTNAVPEYNLFIVLMAGLAIIVAFITAIMGKYLIAAVALAVCSISSHGGFGQGSFFLEWENGYTL